MSVLQALTADLRAAIAALPEASADDVLASNAAIEANLRGVIETMRDRPGLRPSATELQNVHRLFTDYGTAVARSQGRVLRGLNALGLADPVYSAPSATNGAALTKPVSRQRRHLSA